jgi:hypothetical protein
LDSDLTENDPKRYGIISRTEGTVEQIFKLFKGQAKMVQSITKTVTDSNGAKIYQDGTNGSTAMVVNYNYDENGILKEDAGSGEGLSITIHEDQRVKTETTVTQTYAKKAGKAVVAVTVSDGTTTTTVSNQEGEKLEETISKDSTTNTYFYNQQARGINVHSSGSQSSQSVDIKSNTKPTTIGNIVYTYIRKGGKWVAATVVVTSQITSSDGTVTDQQITTEYEYDEYGRLIGAKAKGKVKTTDPYGVESYSELSYEYKIINGQAKLLNSVTLTTSDNKDGTSSSQEMKVFYAYDSNGKLVEEGGVHGGKQIAGADTADKADDVWDRRTFGEGSTTSNDGYDNLNKGTLTQKYEIYRNQAKVTETTTVTDAWHLENGKEIQGSFDGSANSQSMTVTYVYDGNGNLESASGKSDSESKSQDSTTLTDVVQFYSILGGRAVLDKTSTKSNTTGNDGSQAEFDQTSFNFYGENGKLSDVLSINSSISKTYEDAENPTKQTSESKTQGFQTFTLKYGQAKLKETYTRTQFDALNGPKEDLHSGSIQSLTVTYDYDSNGKLKEGGVSGKGETSSWDVASSEDDPGNSNVLSRTIGTVNQEFKLYHGQAKMVQSITATVTGSNGSKIYQDGTNGSKAMVVDYNYDSNGILQEYEITDPNLTESPLGVAWGRGTSVTINEEFESTTVTNVSQVYS